MNNLLLTKFLKLNSISKFKTFLDEERISYISSLSGSTRSLLIKSILSDEKQIVVLLPNRIKVDETKVELSEIGFENKLIVINEFSQEAIQEKINSISQKDTYVLISTYQLLKVKLPNKIELQKNTTILEAGSDITYDELIEYLELLNYSKDKFVSRQGDFSVRGSLIDFWSYSEKHPCRVEFDGDFLESIRNFDPESQRSIGRVESVSLAPNISEDEESVNANIFDYIDNSLLFAEQYELQNLCNKRTSNNDKIIDEQDLSDELKEELFENQDDADEAENDDAHCDETILNYETLLSQNVRWVIEEEIRGNDKRFEFNFTAAPIVNANFDL